jgi:predicted TIM-barrel fold metal-dependent hydrolase
MKRRDLINSALVMGASTMFTPEMARAQEVDDFPPLQIIDTNIHLFQWPFRRLPLDDCGKLVHKFRQLGISQAWAGNFEAILHRDISSANERLFKACRPYSELVAIGSVNLSLPDWQEDLRRCLEVHGMPGVRLYPNYHQYSLADARLAQLLNTAAEAGRFVQIVVAMEDIRTQHSLVQVADVDLVPLVDTLRKVPNSRVQLLNYRPQPNQVKLFADTPGIYFDTARVEGTDGIKVLSSSITSGRCLFGTHAPLFIPESSLIRCVESGVNATVLRALLMDNANAFRKGLSL